MIKKAKVLFISQEICPYLEENQISKISRHLPQGILEKGNEVRIFMPRFGCINERRNQLHEVIRLSGMNMIIDDTDHPLIIKVASIQSARMQVYFIDNEEYFQRKQTLHDKKGELFEDNDERSIFFARGVLETVKKLGWAPDIIHCHGWFTSLVPALIKKSYKDDPLFANSRVVYSAYNNEFSGALRKQYTKKASMEGLTVADLKVAENPTFLNLNKLAIDYSDGVIMGDEEMVPEVLKYAKKSGKPVLGYHNNDTYVDAYANFYAEVLENEPVLV